MDYMIEDIVDPEEYFFWMKLCNEKSSADLRSENKIFAAQQKNDSDSEWLLEYELIYKSHKLENY